MDVTNRIRDGLAGDEQLLGVRAKTHDPILIEVYGQLGFDFAWLDFEHGGGPAHDSRHLESIARTCEVAGIEPLVRVPTGDPALIRKVLDAGIHSVLVPRVETVETARAAVAASRFRYDGGPGGRGHAGGRANAYGARMDGYADRADARTLVGIQIESHAAVERLEELLAVPGLGFVMIGHGDLAVSMGKPMEADDPAVRSAIDRVRSACREAGVPAGRAVSSTEAGRDALAAGYQLVRVGDEVDAVRRQLGERLETLRGERTSG